MSTKIKILIAEHEPADLELLQYELKKGGINYISEVVETEESFSNALKNFIPNIILSDFNFPKFDGPTAFKLREAIAPGTPFIFVSGAIGEEISIEFMRSGVTDYVLKDKLFTLTTKVKRALKESKEKQQKNKIEQELIQSERRLARAQQVAHMGSWELDFATNDVRWSDEACRIYGLRPDKNRQSFETWLSFIHPEDLDHVFKKVKESQDSLIDFSISYRIVQRNGCTRHIYTESKLEFDSSGKPTGLYGIAHDVTETLLLENKLAEERITRQNEITTAVLTAQENERAFIGKELHENLNQILAVAKMYIKMAKTQGKDSMMYLEKSSRMILNVIEEIRRISKTLMIPGTHIFGLTGNIRNLINDMIMIHPLKIEFHVEDIEDERLHEKLQLTIFRIVQEQVNNIVKHAKATEATISLKRQEDEIILLISDNGEGCNILKEKKGVGIINIRSRVELSQGGVTISSKPGKGYQLKVVLPLNSHMNKPGILKTI